jgi:hypothetical protein
MPMKSMAEIRSNSLVFERATDAQTSHLHRASIAPINVLKVDGKRLEEAGCPLMGAGQR